MMNATIDPSTRPARIAPPPSSTVPWYTSPALASASSPTCAALVPAAASALFISPLAHAAMFGMIAITTATQCAFGTSWKACAPISSPM